MSNGAIKTMQRNFIIALFSLRISGQTQPQRQMTHDIKQMNADKIHTACKRQMADTSTAFYNGSAKKRFTAS
tara:strand:+ start:2477 stop:2692 length:216 start_codon:yes stop_codon:yes gene_type:complete